MDDEGAIGGRRHATGKRPEVVVAAAEALDGPERDAGGQHSFNEREGGRLPVPATLKPVPAAVATEDPAGEQDDGECQSRDGAGDRAVAPQRRSERLEPFSPPGGGAEREQDQVLGKHGQLQVELLGAQRKDEANGEGNRGDRDGGSGHMATAQRLSRRRVRLPAHPPQQGVTEREDEQRLQEPGRPRSEVPDLLAYERPERPFTVTVPAIVDVLEEGADDKRVADERDSEPEQPVVRKATWPFAIERRPAQPAGDEEEQTQPEQPTDAEHDGQRGNQGVGHL